jgi:hypothetical protein
MAGGAAIGSFFGDMAFPGFEAGVGDPYDDIFLGLGGALLGALAYEAVAPFLRRHQTGQ